MDIKEVKERLSSLVKLWEAQKPTLCTIDEDDIDAINCLLEENKKLHLRDTYANVTHNQFQTEKKEKRYYENILNELEKWLEEQYSYYSHLPIFLSINRHSLYQEVLEKLKELKGSDK